MSGHENGKGKGAVVSLFHGSGPHAEVEHADNRTLRLSVPGLTVEKVDALIALQRAWIAALKVAHAAGDSEAAARAYEKVAADSALARKEANELEALARAFAGEVWTVRTMKARLEKARQAIAEAEAAGTKPSGRDRVAVEKLPKELLTRQTPQSLERRYGAETIGVLRQREDVLLELHQELNALLRK